MPCNVVLLSITIGLSFKMHAIESTTCREIPHHNFTVKLPQRWPSSYPRCANKDGISLDVMMPVIDSFFAPGDHLVYFVDHSHDVMITLVGLALELIVASGLHIKDSRDPHEILEGEW
jgi:hypothetical protein